MYTLDIYLARLETVRDGLKFAIGHETMPIKLEQYMYNVLIQINREIERTKRALAVLCEAKPLPDRFAGSDFPEPFVTDDQLPLIDETVQKKKAR